MRKQWYYSAFFAIIIIQFLIELGLIFINFDLLSAYNSIKKQYNIISTINPFALLYKNTLNSVSAGLFLDFILLILTLSAFILAVRFKDNIFNNNNYLENAALTDSLTGLYNRRYFDSFYENIFAQSYRYDISHSLIMCDIDHFKKINDTYGHDKGDIVLKEVSDVLKNNIRKSDIAVRFGGEEFIVCLPSTNIANAVDVARKIKQMISKIRTKDIKKVTVSMGVAFYKKEFGNESKDMLKHLDNLLYEAKNRGRNRIISGDHQGSIIEVEENPWADE